MFYNMFVDNFVFGYTLKGGFLLHLFFLLLDQSRWRTATFDILIGQFSIAPIWGSVAHFAHLFYVQFSIVNCPFLLHHLCNHVTVLPGSINTRTLKFREDFTFRLLRVHLDRHFVDIFSF